MGDVVARLLQQWSGIDSFLAAEVWGLAEEKK